ncbi:MAG: hypothetical protein QM703_13065 [Gemmatales bacterium]
MPLFLVLLTLFTQDPSPKSKHPTADELRETLKAGTFKHTQDDVLKLIGTPAEMKMPGPDGALAQWTWNYDTHIVATFKDDKLSGITGCFSPHLPVDRVTADHFKRLRVGMTEMEAVEILGKSSSSARVGATLLLAWGKTAQLTVSFNAKGLAFGAGLSQSGYVALPNGVEIPLPGLEKK